MSSRLYEEFQEEQIRKKEALLELPDQVADTHEVVEQLAERLEKSAVEVSELKIRLSEASSLKAQLKNGALGFIIGCASSIVIWYFTK